MNQPTNETDAYAEYEKYQVFLYLKKKKRRIILTFNFRSQNKTKKQKHLVLSYFNSRSYTHQTSFQLFEHDVAFHQFEISQKRQTNGPKSTGQS